MDRFRQCASPRPGALAGRLIRTALVAVAILTAAASAAPAGDGEILVFAAASLRGALDEAASGFERGRGARIVAAYASSSTLARQIAHGAPAELFISAHPGWMDHLAERGLIRAGTRRDLLGNALVLVARAGSDIELAVERGFPLAAALRDGRLAMGDPGHVPAGIYAKAALEALGVWPDLKRRLARAENVRAALALVSRGEAPLGIVYRSDARADPGVGVVGRFPRWSHPPIIYPAAVTAAAEGPGAERLLGYLASPAAAAVFGRHGFDVLE